MDYNTYSNLVKAIGALTNEQLDYLVSKVMGWETKIVAGKNIFVGTPDTWKAAGGFDNPLVGQVVNPVTEWGYGGQVLDKFRVSFMSLKTEWYASTMVNDGPLVGGVDVSQLKAAMKAVIAAHYTIEGLKFDDDN